MRISSNHWIFFSVTNLEIRGMTFDCTGDSTSVGPKVEAVENSISSLYRWQRNDKSETKESSVNSLSGNGCQRSIYSTYYPLQLPPITVNSHINEEADIYEKAMRTLEFSFHYSSSVTNSAVCKTRTQDPDRGPGDPCKTRTHVKLDGGIRKYNSLWRGITFYYYTRTCRWV